MGLRISTNIPSLAAQSSLGKTSRQQEKTLNQLSSGSRITTAADDAAGLAISEKLKGNIRSLNQANRNANDGISLVQSAEGGINEISNILVRLRELAVQSASDTVGDQERGYTELEYRNLVDEIQRISATTEFNGHKLLTGEKEKFDFQIGVHNKDVEDRISFEAGRIKAGVEHLQIHETSVLKKELAQQSLANIDGAIDSVSLSRSELGALQSRLTSTSNNLLTLRENASAANSRIRDTDYAVATSDNTRLNILKAAGASVLAQANSSASTALKLIG